MFGALLTLLAGCGLGVYELYKAGEQGNTTIANYSEAKRSENEFGLYYDGCGKTRDVETNREAYRMMDHRGHWCVYDRKTGRQLRDITDVRNAKENEENLQRAIAEHKRFYKYTGLRDKNIWKDRKTGHFYMRRQHYNNDEMRWVSQYSKYTDEYAYSDGIHPIKGFMFAPMDDPEHFVTDDYME